MKRRLTSRHFDQRDRERDSGHTPDLFRNPIRVPVGHFLSRLHLFIVYSDGRSRTAHDEEEQAWAEGTLNLPLLPSPRRRS